MYQPNLANRTLATAQRGVILVIALVVLVAMTLAAVGLVRTVDTGSLVAGNISFRQDATSQADLGMKVAAAAAASIMADATGAAELNDNPPYYATPLATDNRGIPSILVNAAAPTAPGSSVGTSGVGELAIPLSTAGGGIVIRYVLERTCQTAGVATDPLQCRTFTPPALLSRSIGVREVSPPASPYVRATVRVDGPTNVVSYVQAMVR